MSSTSRDRAAPWPAQTPNSPPTTTHRRPRDRRPSLARAEPIARRLEHRRDDIADEDQVQNAMTQCEVFSPNNVFSCWPTADTEVVQHQFASFVWNSRLPQFAQTNLVNIYLFSATSQEVLLQWNNVTNPGNNAGVIHPQVNDAWWGDRGNLWNGSNLTFLYYFVVTRADQSLDNTVVPQPIFTAVQTTFADSIIASMSSTSAAAASSRSAASAAASSASALSASSIAHQGGLGSSSTTNGTAPSATSSAGLGNVQSTGGSSSFPHWAIAVIVVLGFFALLAGGILFFVIVRRTRARRRLSHRGSMGSSTPMMANANAGEPTSPVVASAYGAVGTHRPPSPEVHDGASTVSRVSDAALFSGADAAVMADAFRAALRKPNFADRPVEEGESPESDPRAHKETDLLNEALTEEGRDIRSVGSSRGVKVETLSDAGDNNDTLQERPPH